MRNRVRTAIIVAAIGVLGTLPAAAQQGWWMEEPIRFLQTNLREIDTGLDPARLAGQVDDFHANVLLFGMGGIVAHYPTEVAFHYRSPTLPVDRDTFGEMVREAHARGIRVIGRFDFSKTQKPVWDAHPEWFFMRANGEPVEYNGLYSVCINGGWYRGHIYEILTEALTRYEVDGLFFNMFGNPGSDYSGNRMGPCRCDACKRKFREEYGRELPEDDSDPYYREFMARSADEVAERIGALIRKLRPEATFNTYIQDHVTGIMSESNTSVTRPLPQWPYSASDNVDFARTSRPDKMAFNLSMAFVDYAWRFAAVPPNEVRIRLHQALSRGGALAIAMLGTMDQEDRTHLEAARPIFAWAAENEDLYVGQENQGRVLLLGPRGNSYRGFFRLLSEEHLPFRVAGDARLVGESPEAVDLVISAGRTPPELDDWVRNGGRLLVASTEPPFGMPEPVERWEDVSGYFRIRDHSILPSLADTDLVFQLGDYAEMPEVASPVLTFIPPSMYGPPEKVFGDKVETNKPGLVIRDHGRGRIAWLPWDVGGLYYRHGNHNHAALLADLIDHLLPRGRQLRTDAHPLVEISFMRQEARNRTLVHFVNLSGHSDTSWHDPVPMEDIEVTVDGEYHSAAARGAGSLSVSGSEGATTFRLPRLDGYDVVVLE